MTQTIGKKYKEQPSSGKPWPWRLMNYTSEVRERPWTSMFSPLIGHQPRKGINLLCVLNSFTLIHATRTGHRCRFLWVSWFWKRCLYYSLEMKLLTCSSVICIPWSRKKYLYYSCQMKLLICSSLIWISRSRNKYTLYTSDIKLHLPLGAKSFSDLPVFYSWVLRSRNESSQANNQKQRVSEYPSGPVVHLEIAFGRPDNLLTLRVFLEWAGLKGIQVDSN